MTALLTNRREIVARIGFYLLVITFFMISNQRMISLYSLSIAMMVGFYIWVTDFSATFKYLMDKWYIVFPPVLYFLLYLVSIVIQNGSYNLLVTYLMFLFVPLLLTPVLNTDYTKNRLSDFFKFYVAGLLLVSVFLIIRVIIVFFIDLPEGQSALEYFTKNNPRYVSWGFSVLEHPTYFSMKLVFALFVLFHFHDRWKIKSYIVWAVLLIFTIVIFMLASKAGIIAWLISWFAILISSIRRRRMNPVSYIIVFVLLIALAAVSLKKIDRISFFIVYTGRGIKQENFDWKNLDQRTRNWYAATTLIRDHPLTGNGMARTQDRMVDVYLKNGFKEEAELRMNAHNQFLEAQMTFGIVGTLSLLWMIFTPILFRKKVLLRNLVLPFVLIFIFFISFESMLNRQWGIMYYLLFYFVIMLSMPLNSSEENIIIN